MALSPLTWNNQLMPPTERTTNAVLSALARQAPDWPAVREDGEPLDFAALERQSRLMAGNLRAGGLRPGEVVLLDGAVGLSLTLGLLSVTRLGAIALYIHRLWQREAALALIEAARPVACLGGDFYRTGLPRLALAAGDGDRLFTPPAETDPAMYRVSSGTTGKPKLIRVTQAQLWQRLSCPQPHFLPGCSYGFILPNVFPAYQLLAVLGAGGTAVFGRGTSVGAIERFLQTERLNYIWGIPALYEQLVKSRRKPLPLPELRAALSSGSRLNPETKRGIENRWGSPLHEFYGQSELGFLAESAPDTPCGSVGKASPGVELRVAEGGEVTPPGCPGSVLARTAYGFGGYLNEESAVDPYGWRETGDRGYLDSRGNLFLLGRKDNQIQTSGFKVDPEEVAAVIASRPGVEDLHVFGLADRVRGEIVAAALVARADFDLEALRAHCRHSLPAHKRPKRYFLLDRLPRGPLGKVNQTALLELVDPGKNTERGGEMGNALDS